MQITHIYWFAYFSLEEPSVRYRAAYPLAHLAAVHGITYDLVHPGYDRYHVWRFLRIYLSALLFRRNGSVIVVQKMYTAGLYARALKFLLRVRRRHTVYDIDDAEYVRRPGQTMYACMRLASRVAAGSQQLMDDARTHNAAVFFLGSPVIPHAHRHGRRQTPLCIGWIGYYGAHRANLEAYLFPALKGLDFPVRLRVLGVKDAAELAELCVVFAAHPHVQVEAPLGIDWHDEQTVYAQLAGCDIGAAPLLDTHFNRAKSAFKLKQCLSCGVPVLASPVGENARYLQHGVNGFLCDSLEAYHEAIAALAGMADADFARMQVAAAETAAAFSVADYCGRFLRMLGDARG